MNKFIRYLTSLVLRREGTRMDSFCDGVGDFLKRQDQQLQQDILNKHDVLTTSTAMYRDQLIQKYTVLPVTMHWEKVRYNRLGSEVVYHLPFSDNSTLLSFDMKGTLGDARIHLNKQAEELTFTWEASSHTEVMIGKRWASLEVQFKKQMANITQKITKHNDELSKKVRDLIADRKKELS